MAIFEKIETPPGARRRLKLKSPATLEVIGEIECASREDVAAAVAKARNAQKAWGKLPVKERVKFVLRARDLLLQRQDEVVKTVIRETGKVPADAYTMEVSAPLDAMSFYAKRAAKFLAPEKRGIHGMIGMIKAMRIAYKPLGVIGVISPWNAPVVLSINPATQALLAGNAVIIKGSEVTPESVKLIETLYRDAGLPDGLMQVLYGDGQTGADLVESGVQKIAFTGSEATGRKIGEACGRQLIPCSLELGGTDAMIVCGDAHFDQAVEGALMSSCLNTGHYCCGTQRVYVVESIYEKFVNSVAAKAKALRQGQQHGQSEDLGAVFWDRQMTIIEEHVQDAIKKGARVLAGGRRNPDLPGLYYEATVLADCTHDMLVMREETFGPVVCLQSVRDEADAIRLANDSPYGLSGTVWSSDREKACRIALQIDTGSVSINDVALTYGSLDAPFGGVKASGIGQVNGVNGLRSYCHAFPVIVDRFNKSKPSLAYPYSEKNVSGTKGFMKFLYTSAIGRFFQ